MSGTIGGSASGAGTETISKKYIVIESLKNQGGMGHVVHAKDLLTEKHVAIKYCLDDADEDEKKRFKREVRLLSKYSNSGFTIPILDHSLENEPYYFVMPFADGDLTLFTTIPFEEKEKVVLRMVDCVNFLHSNGDYHRDIKPENFLSYKGEIVLSDLGLAKDPNSETQFTQSVHVGGTHIYAPPSFFEGKGGFKMPTIEDDIFSLGKSIYFIITGRLPWFLTSDNIPPAILQVIKNCTANEQENRYHSCDALKNDLITSFDMALNRGTQDQEFFELKKNYQTLTDNDFIKFIRLFSNLSGQEKEALYDKTSNHLFFKIASSPNLAFLAGYLVESYEDIRIYAKTKKHWPPFQYAEQVATDIQTLCLSKYVSDVDKSRGLKIAVEFATSLNRGAAAKTCASIIEGIESDIFAISALPLITISNTLLIRALKAEACKHPHITKAVLAAQVLAP